METIFTKIIKREIPSHIIYEDEHTIVIPDKFPSMPGQILVITKEPVAYIFDLPEEVYAHLMKVTKRIAQALDAISGQDRTCIVVEGFEVPHVHIRLYPCSAPGVVLTPKIEAPEETIKSLAKELQSLLEKQN